MNHVIIQCPYFPMHASSLLPFVDASQLLLQSGLPDDGDGRGPAAVLPQRHINLSKKKKVLNLSVYVVLLTKHPDDTDVRDHHFILH